MLERIHCTSTENEFLSWFFSIARKNLSYSHSSVIDSCHSSLSDGFIQQSKASRRRQWGPKPIVTLVGLYGFIKYLFASLGLHLQLRGSYFLINQSLVITCSYLFLLKTPCKGCKRKWEECPIKFIILKTFQLHLIIKMVTDLQSCLWTHLALLDKGQQVKNHNSNKHKWRGFERPSISENDYCSPDVILGIVFYRWPGKQASNTKNIFKDLQVKFWVGFDWLLCRGWGCEELL